MIRILIVDDEKGIPQALRDYLEDAGEYEVRVAGSGEEGLLLLPDFEPDACIVDMRLPGMDGNEFILTAHAARPDTIFIIHTGSVDYVLPERLREIGLTEEMIMHKPLLDMRIFEDILTGLLPQKGNRT